MKLKHVFCLGVLSALLFFGPLLRAPRAAGEEKVKFGVLLCLTGPCAEWGNNSRRGIELAAEEINAKGGILGKKIELVVQDTKEGSASANAVSAFQQLVLDRDVSYVIGPTWSVGGLPIAPLVARRQDLIVTSPSVGIAEFNESAGNIFNTWPHDSYATKGLAALVRDRGIKRVAIFSGNDPWVLTQGNTFESEFKRLGGEITTKVEPNPESPEVMSEVLRMKSGNPEAVFYSNTYDQAKAARRLKELKFDGKQFSIQMDLTRVREAQGAFDGLVFALFPEAAPAFREAFEKKFGEKPGITADTAYDTVHMYARAIAAAGSFDPAAVKEEILKLDFQGASGRVVFDAKGGVVREPAYYRVRGESFQPETAG